MGKIRRGVGLLCYVSACMAGICLLCTGVRLCQGERALRENVWLLCEEKITVSQARKIRAEETEKDNPTEFTAWTVAGIHDIWDSEKYHSAKTEVIELNGSSELLLFSGSVLHEEDREGCLLGKKTAERLFGSTNVQGQAVCYGDRILKVRGILWEIDEILLVQAKEHALLERITLQGKAGITGSMQAERFCMNYGISAGLLRVEIFGRDFLRELVPGKWSDFEGFRNNAETFYGGVSLYQSCDKSRAEQQSLFALKRGRLLSAAGCLLLIILFARNQYIRAIPKAAAALYNNLTVRR